MSLKRKYSNFLGFINTVGFKALFAYFFLFFLKKITKIFNLIFNKLVSINLEKQQVGLLHWNGKSTQSAQSYNASDQWLVLKKACDEIIKHDLITIGDQSYDLSDDAIWFYDPVNKSYINKSVTLNNYVIELKNTRFDLRVVWELNRLQFLVPLAQVAVITGDRAYIDYALQILNKWIAQNGYTAGPNWMDAQESGIRLVNVLLFKEIIEKAGGCISLPKWFIFYHVKFLLAGLSIRRITHNHFFTESCSLYATLLLLKPRFLSLVSYFIADVIMIEVNKQLDRNGFSYEGSSNYTLFVYDALALVSALEIDRNAMRLVKKIDYAPFASCCAALDLANGDIVKIGDADCGRYVKVNWVADLSRPLEYDLFQSFESTNNHGSYYLGFLFAQNVLLPVTGERRAELDKLKHVTYQNKRAGLFISTNISTQKSRKVVIQGGATCINNDVGIDHIHSDLMSFIYFIDGKSVFIDPSTFLYINGLTQRQALRSAKRHNCVVIDEHEYAKQGKSFFGITHLTLVKQFEVIESQDSVEVFCEVVMQEGAVKSSLRRHFILSADLTSLQINTSGEMLGKHSVTEYINMSRKVNTLTSKQCLIALSEKQRIMIHFQALNAKDDKKNKATKVIKLSGKTIAWAPRYGSLSRGYQIKRAVDFNDQFAFSTSITLEQGVE